MLTDFKHFWAEIEKGMYVLRLSHPFTSDDYAWISAFGSLILLCIVHIYQIPQPISLSLIEATFHGLDSIDDQDWLEDVNSSVSDSLRQWPRDPAVTIDWANPFNAAILTQTLERQVCTFFGTCNIGLCSLY